MISAYHPANPSKKGIDISSKGKAAEKKTPLHDPPITISFHSNHGCMVEVYITHAINIRRTHTTYMNTQHHSAAQHKHSTQHTAHHTHQSSALRQKTWPRHPLSPLWWCAGRCRAPGTASARGLGWQVVAHDGKGHPAGDPVGGVHSTLSPARQVTWDKFPEYWPVFQGHKPPYPPSNRGCSFRNEKKT